MNKVIAIDGPAGSGKGTIAKIIAEKCNLVYIDTGATYRALALLTLKNNIAINDEDSIVKLSENLDVKLTQDNQVFLNGIDVTKEIRTKEVSDIVSTISSIPLVRQNMVDIQRNMANNNDVIMEGRDITTVVFPNATYKFYLDASIDVRAKRRYEQYKVSGTEITLEEVKESIEKRDYNDMHKSVGALKHVEDQIYIDTSDMTIDEVVNKIINIIKGEVL